ncbi:MAG TPA: hydroxyacid dehydrogenase [Candidatus Bathyarchaeia archaeon]
MKIAFFETNNWERSYFKKKLKGHVLRFFAETLSLENVNEIKDFDAISVFVYSKIDARIIDALPNLRLVATRSTGFDHIDVKACKEKKITVSNVPSYGENTVAEHAFALILALSRNICKAYTRSLRYNFEIEGLKGFDLKDKTLGVVGAGRIGLHVIRIAKGFGMNVLAYDVNQNNLLPEVLGFEYASLEDVLSKSDVITLHVPYNKFTHHLINKDSIKLIKKGAVLINTSRGAVVDTEALIEGLNKGILSGAGLDVLEGEELIKEEKQLLYDQEKLETLSNLVKGHILLSKENVVFTPHIAFYSQEALERILEVTVQNIVAFSSENPQNIV